MNIQEARLNSLTKRVSKLEKKVFKNNRPNVTMGQKLLLLRETGLIESFGKLFRTKELLYKFLTLCLDEDSANIKKYLNNRELLEIEENYIFLIETYKNLQLKDLIKPAEEKLKKLGKKG